jgi:SAM-dependent methyltransferase
MALSDAEKALVKELVDRGDPLPERFRWTLFAEPRETELIWPGKTSEVTTAVLPFQSIEQIDEPRAEADAGAYGTGDLFSAGGRQTGGWTNKLVWGDNKLVLSSLKGGPLRREIENAGGLKLVYIDPPFDVGADFSFDIEVGGNETLKKEPTVVEDVAYRDTWGRGLDSYSSMLLERLRLIRDLAAESFTIYCHLGRNVSHLGRSALDDVFGADRFINEITWKRSHAHGDTGQGAVHFGRVTEAILVYAIGDQPVWNPQYTAYTDQILERDYKYFDEETGEQYRLMPVDGPGGAAKGNPYYEFLGVKGYWRYSKETMQSLYDLGEIVLSSTGKSLSRKRFLKDAKGTPVTDLWDDVNRISPTSNERLDYPTQKPEALMERIISTSSNPGDLVADFFCGSGTTLAVAEKLGRKWIGGDLGRFAIHTSRKRLIGVQRQLKTEGKPYRSFEILNLGKYERQWFVGIDPNLPPEQREAAAAAKEGRYVALILEAYKAEPIGQTPPFHGRKGNAVVLVGPVDAPVTEASVADAVAAARKANTRNVDVLGFEFEMGLAPRLVDDARAKGVELALRYIPKDVFDRRAVEKGQVSFYDLAYVEAKPTVNKKTRTVTVSLTDFGVSYRQEDTDALVAGMKSGSRVSVDGGQVVKLTKDKDGSVTRDVLTKQWTDWIDYWAVDFDYHSRAETLYETISLPDGAVKHVPQWTGRYIFENEWQSFRTRRDRTLELTSAPHSYDRAGRYFIAIKVIDIFGNDTTKVIGVEV